MIFQGSAGRYAKLSEGEFKYHGGIDLSEYYIISTQFADSNGSNDTRQTREWEVQVMVQTKLQKKPQLITHLCYS